MFRSYGIGKGDIVAIYMPVSPMAVATMLACARIGAIHSVVFAGFSSQSLTSRIQVSLKIFYQLIIGEICVANLKAPLGMV